MLRSKKRQFALIYVVPALIILRLVSFERVTNKKYSWSASFAYHGDDDKLGALLDPRSTTHKEDSLPRAMDDVVRILLSSSAEAEAYIEAHRSFKFHVYKLPETSSWSYMAACNEQRYNVLHWRNYMDKDFSETGTEVSNCDWGRTVCEHVTASSSPYSSRRYNRNGDVVLSKILTSYDGSMRTIAENDGALWIVPYASSAHCACVNDRARCKLITQDMIQDRVLTHLTQYNNTTARRHVFLASVQRELIHPFFKSTNSSLITLEVPRPKEQCASSSDNCAILLQPYVNTHPAYQPHLLTSEQLFPKASNERSYALAAVLSQSIGRGSSDPRRALMEVMTNVTTIAGRPVAVRLLNRRTLGNESTVLSLYRQSIFCPCLRGNTPAQKRIFDVWMSGCIPVVLAYYNVSGGTEMSHFSSKGPPLRQTYPFARGTFHGQPQMGIDYSKLVVEIDDSGCGIRCLLPTLEDMLTNRMDEIRTKQQAIGRVAQLFAHGMEDHSTRHPDAVAALLVQLRHYESEM